jgi:hypothetical protein
MFAPVIGVDSALHLTGEVGDVQPAGAAGIHRILSTSVIRTRAAPRQ